MGTNKLKGPVVDQIVARFLNGASLKFSGVQFQISSDRLTLRIESDDALQKVFEGTADERLDEAKIAFDHLTSSSAVIQEAVVPLKRRFVLIERFSGREICEKDGDEGSVEWKPGYPSDTNLAADEKERSDIAVAAEKLKAPLVGQRVDGFLKGAPLDYSGVRFRITGDQLTLRIESNDALQKVFADTADERLDEAKIRLGHLTATSPAIREALLPLKKRFVLTERFSGREICERNGDDGTIEWMPGYPSDTNLGADDGDRSLEPVANLMSTREALIAVGNLLLTFLAAAAVSGATYFLSRSVVPELAALITVFAVVFFFHSLLSETVIKTIVAFVLATGSAWLAIRYIPVFEVNYSFSWQLTGDIIGFLIGLCTGRPLAYVYKKLEHK